VQTVSAGRGLFGSLKYRFFGLSVEKNLTDANSHDWILYFLHPRLSKSSPSITIVLRLLIWTHAISGPEEVDYR